MLKTKNSRNTVIDKALVKVNLEKLARDTLFVQRKPRKASVELIVKSLLHTTLQSKWSLRKQSLQLGMLGGFKYAKQTMCKRLNKNAFIFFETLLTEMMKLRFSDKTHATHLSELRCFKRVLIQDSTCIKLLPHQRKDFPGGRNQTATKQSILKLQVIYDFLNESFVSFGINAFTRNDQAAAFDVINYCKRGDLVLRDLGYFSIKSLDAINSKKSYYISRLRTGVSLYDKEGKTINLLKILKKKNYLDKTVYLGSTHRMKVRIIAKKLPPEVEAQRKRRAKNDRHSRSNPSKKTLALLGWEIYISNLDYKNYSSKFIVKCYSLRWRIENLFKAYKQYGALTVMPRGNVHQVKITMIAKLIFITIVHQLYAKDIYKCKRISFIKYFEFISLIWIYLFYISDNSSCFWRSPELIEYYTAYEHKHRPSIMDVSLKTLG